MSSQRDVWLVVFRGGNEARAIRTDWNTSRLCKHSRYQMTVPSPTGAAKDDTRSLTISNRNGHGEGGFPKACSRSLPLASVGQPGQVFWDVYASRRQKSRHTTTALMSRQCQGLIDRNLRDSSMNFWVKRILVVDSECDEWLLSITLARPRKIYFQASFKWNLCCGP